jgi:hypothetical protein
MNVNRLAAKLGNPGTLPRFTHLCSVHIGAPRVLLAPARIKSLGDPPS